LPHIIIETSANVAERHNIDDLVTVVHTRAIDHGLASVTALRTRAAIREHFQAMSGEPHFAFVAITCRIGPGRTEQDKVSFIEAILDAAMAHLDHTPLTIAWSIEVTELDPTFRINHNHVRVAMEEAQGSP